MILAEDIISRTATHRMTRPGHSSLSEEPLLSGDNPLSSLLSAPERLPLPELEEACRQESLLFQRRQPTDGRFGLELFRRALEEHSEPAWEALLRVYGDLTAHWVRSHPNFYYTLEEEAYFVNRAFERLWRNVAESPGKFRRFPNLSALLRFVKLCVHSAVVDDGPPLPAWQASDPELTTTAAEDASFGEIGSTELAEAAAERRPTTYDDLPPAGRHDFWRAVDSCLTNEAERVVIYGYFYYGIKNQELYAMYPRLFQSVKQLANIRLNVLRRLARVPELEALLRDLLDDAPFARPWLTC